MSPVRTVTLRSGMDQYEKGPRLLSLTNQKDKDDIPVFLNLNKRFIASSSNGDNRLFLARGRKVLRKPELLISAFWKSINRISDVSKTSPLRKPPIIASYRKPRGLKASAVFLKLPAKIGLT